MAVFDEFVPNFLKAKERWPDARLLSRHYDAVRESYEGSGLDTVGTAKSFVETVGRTILGEFGKTADDDATTTRIVQQSMECVGLVNARGATKLDTVLSAHNKMADALSFIRNNFDPGAHGKDGFIDFPHHERKQDLSSHRRFSSGHDPWRIRWTRAGYSLHKRAIRAIRALA